MPTNVVAQCALGRSICEWMKLARFADDTLLPPLQRSGFGTSRWQLVEMLCSENGNALPCRAVVGRWDQDNAAFFLALISLELPARLKRSQSANSMAAALLAA